MKKIILFIFLSVFLISCVSSLESMGTFKQNECVRVPQTCASCSYVNISSISYPNSTTIIENVVMTNLGNGEWFYNFCNTTLVGRYDVRGKGDKDGSETSFATYFTITPNGKESSTGESILYSLSLFILSGFLILLFYLIIVLPKDNRSNENDGSIEIIKLKYVRVFLIAICYPLTIIILNLLNSVAINYIGLSNFSGTIGFLFEIMIRSAWVFTIIIILWLVYLLIKDSNVKRNLDRFGRIRI